MAVLFCLPHAGGGRTAFTGWPRELPVDIDVQPVCLPGRDHRIGDDPRIDPVEIAEAVTARADRPYALYGHSMGARIAFEVIRQLRRDGRPLPVRCYVAAARPPDTVDHELSTSIRLPDSEFAARVARLGGISAEILAEPELMALIMPVLRADLGWLDRYRYRAEPPLPVPIVAFAGQDDPGLDPSVMQGWRRHTAGPFRLHPIPGGHFFPTQSLPVLARMIAADLLPAVTDPCLAGAARTHPDDRTGAGFDPTHRAGPPSSGATGPTHTGRRQA